MGTNQVCLSQARRPIRWAMAALQPAQFPADAVDRRRDRRGSEPSDAGCGEVAAMGATIRLAHRAEWERAMSTHHAVLMTQCLQSDFIATLGLHDPLPNALHVGAEESLRLMGAVAEDGPVAQLLRWARSQPQESLDIVHIRDIHDPNDPAQAEHLRTFGHHCLAGQPGAALVLGLDAEGQVLDNERFVDATGLSDFEGTHLPDELARIYDRLHGRSVRIGVVGVWTDAKVSFLLYDLKTRLQRQFPGVPVELATCSALTASSSRLQHFNALEQLQRLLNVTVFDSVGQFARWLAQEGAALPALVSPRKGAGAQVIVAEGEALSEDGEAIVQHLFRGSRTVELHALGGGFSGARVFRATSQDAFGHEQAPSVVKLGPNALIGKERTAFERVESVLGNAAPRVRGFVDLGAWAGLQYSYAAMGRGEIRTLKSLFESGASVERIVDVLTTVMDEILAPFFAAARYERLPLFGHYGFARTEITAAGPRLMAELRYAAQVRQRVEDLIGGPAGPHLALADGSSVYNPCRFYEEFLPSAPIPQSDAHYVATVHGDLNAANILIDPRDNVWLIDFFHTGQGHVWKDLIKLENDLLYILTPLDNDDDLRQALRITAALDAVADLRAPLPEALDGLTRPPLLRAWAVLRALRAIGARVTAEDRHPWQVSLGLLRYAVHTLSFDESSPLQKQWALASAGRHAQAVVRHLDRERPLQPSWVALDDTGLPPSAGLAVVLCPGRKDRGRDLQTDLQLLASQGVRALYGFITEPELAAVGAQSIADQARALGMEYLLLPIPDQGVPTHAEALAWVRQAIERLQHGEKLVFHCLGGLGRSGMLAACVLAACGIPRQDAVARVRAARGPRALETTEQEQFTLHLPL